MKVLIVIPARLRSERLPRKVLLKETGKYLVQHVYERALQVERADSVVIATDHTTILMATEKFGADAVMTDPAHPSGSDRVAEVARKRDADLVVNLQADEPEIEPSDVDALIAAMTPDLVMGTLVYDKLTENDQRDRSVVKAVVEQGWAIDFRREPTPGAMRHLGIYAYRADFLQEFTRLPPSPRETERRLEQMRALDNKKRIRAVLASHASIGIDEPEDYAVFVSRYREQN